MADESKGALPTLLLVAVLAYVIWRAVQAARVAAPPPKPTTGTTTTTNDLGIPVANTVAGMLTSSYDAHDVSASAGDDPQFCFQPEVQTETDGTVSFSSPLDMQGGQNFRRLFLRHVFWPAQRVEPSRDLAIVHVAHACAMLKGFSSNPRVTAYNVPDVGTAVAVGVVSDVLKSIPVGGDFLKLFDASVQAGEDAIIASGKTFFNWWADVYQPPDPQDFLGPSGDGGQAEDPLPPANVFGGGGGRVDAQWWFASGPAMWRNDRPKWIGCAAPDPVFGCPPGTGTYDPGKGVVNTTPWVLTADEIPADMAGRYRAGDTIFVRARLFSVSPTLGKMILPWQFVGGESAVIRDRINLVARIYRLIDMFACLKWNAYTPPNTNAWSDPKFGLMRGSIFRPTPLQAQAHTAATAKAIATAISPAELAASLLQADGVVTSDPVSAAPVATTTAAPIDVAAIVVPPPAAPSAAPSAPITTAATILPPAIVTAEPAPVATTEVVALPPTLDPAIVVAAPAAPATRLTLRSLPLGL